MSNKKQSTKQAAPPTVITLTLPEADGAEQKGTLLIQRGDLAHVRQFTYLGVSDIAAAIKEAYIALAAVEAEPPVILEAPKAAPKSEPRTKPKAAQEPVVEEEPTIDIPLKKGTRAVKISHLKIVGGETDAAAYRQAVLIAGKLIDGRLWDGQSPIRIADVYAVAKKMQYLTDKDLSLFTLNDFVQAGGAGDAPEAAEDVESPAVKAADSRLEVQPLPAASSAPINGGTFSANGQRPDDPADE
jgi:hypothetical protein